jgi:hypothetical protein
MGFDNDERVMNMRELLRRDNIPSSSPAQSKPKFSSSNDAGYPKVPTTKVVFNQANTGLGGF